MSWLIVGTVPQRDFPLIHHTAVIHGGTLSVEGRSVPIARGTPALVAAACLICRELGVIPPDVLLCGDIGDGDGSRKIYRYLAESGLTHGDYSGILFHYLQPDVDWHNRILIAIDTLPRRPILIADAGYMYVAKMSGYAADYDLFTPDAGELAFLADEKAPHPFYTRGFLLHEENRVPDLIQKAIVCGNAARHLLVKGQSDHIVSGGDIVAVISTPCVEAMEPVGGTGDSLAGIAFGLAASGKSILDACIQASRLNRYMGLYATPTPASSISDLLGFLPDAAQKHLT